MADDHHEGPVPGQMVTYWVIYDDGSTGKIDTDTGGAPELLRPGRLVTEDEYMAQVQAVREQQAEHLEDLLDGEAAQQVEDYQALLAAGVPEATARRMSGYTGPAPEDGGPQ